MDEICILGGGASALMVACFAKENKKITIIEQNDKLGKKILATGNGRCNLTNLNRNINSYNTNLDKFFNRFDVKDTLNFFNKIGLETYADEEGRVYPLSNSAVSVVDVLKNYLNTKNNISYLLTTKIEKIEKFGQKYKIIFEDKNERVFSKIVVAMGNYADLNLFKNLGIKTKDFSKSLCSLKAEKNKLLSGVRVDNVLVSSKLNKSTFKEVGEILFKDDGVSGIVIFNLSSYMARENNYNHTVEFDFLPNISKDDLLNLLIKRKNNLKDMLINDFLTGFFHKNLNFDILKKSKLNLEKKVESLSKNDLINLVNLIKNYTIHTNGFFDNNQVMSGGVLLDELNDNLESKLNKNLFFVGEVVNVDGMCGGYNLQWAWTSGKIVGEII